jgi:excisionase family DNA binding protein
MCKLQTTVFSLDYTFRLRYIFSVFNKELMKLLSTAQAAEILGISERRVRLLITNGKLIAQKLGRDYAIEEQALRSVIVYGKPGRPPKPRTKPEAKKMAKRKR